MKELGFDKRIYSSFILLLICATIIAISGIYGFQRLAPAINIINSRNTQSLYYAEEMLKSISKEKNIKTFEFYLNKSKNNITEKNEKEAVSNIEKSYKPAFNGDKNAEELTINYIIDLTNVNRKAMEEAGNCALRLEKIGIWLIVFLTIFAWVTGFILLKLFDSTLIKPLSELKSVLFEYRKGNKMRRCPKIAKSQEFQELYNCTNFLLDNMEK